MVITNVRSFTPKNAGARFSHKEWNHRNQSQDQQVTKIILLQFLVHFFQQAFFAIICVNFCVQEITQNGFSRQKYQRRANGRRKNIENRTWEGGEKKTTLVNVISDAPGNENATTKI